MATNFTSQNSVAETQPELLERIRGMGYETELAYLPGLDTVLPIRRGDGVRVNGAVEDLTQRVKKAHAEIGGIPDESLTSSSMGKCIAHLTRWGGTIVDTYVQKPSEGYTYLTEWFNQGHEETHALIRLDRQDILRRELKKLGFQIDPFNHWNDEELQAHVGGIIALLKHAPDALYDLNVLKTLPIEVASVYLDMQRNRDKSVSLPEGDPFRCSVNKVLEAGNAELKYDRSLAAIGRLVRSWIE